MINYYRLAAMMDGVVSQHYQYISEGYLAPRWQGEPPTHRMYNMPGGDGKPYVALAIPLQPEEQTLGVDEFEKVIRRKIRLLGPVPSKSEWESRKREKVA